MIKRSSFKAVLFDLDGVLIDSMDAHVEAWKKAYADFGITVSSQEIRLREGEKSQCSARDIANRNGLNLSDNEISELLRRKREFYGDTAPNDMKPGVREILIDLKNDGYKLGLVTGSIWRNLNLVLSDEDKSLFSVIITSEDVKNSKPSPEPYLSAMEALELSPLDCLVVENAPLGIHAGKAAGMKVAGITTTLPSENLSEADWIFGRIDDLRRII